ncbi:MAG: recombination mediator RecR [Elusimicrobiota bacterium]
MQTGALSVLADALRKVLRNIGPRQSQRMALQVLRLPESDFKSFVDALVQARSRVRQCRLCHDLTESEVCAICRDPHRDRSVICVVENAQDVEALETAGGFNGLYHVLHGSLDARFDPGVASAHVQLTINGFFSRLRNDFAVKEVILALDHDTDGEMTSLYLIEELSGRFPQVRVTRTGMGIPFGGEIVYADSSTLKHAISSRIAVEACKKG